MSHDTFKILGFIGVSRYTCYVIVFDYKVNCSASTDSLYSFHFVEFFCKPMNAFYYNIADLCVNMSSAMTTYICRLKG